MTEDENNLVLRLLREIRDEQAKTDEKLALFATTLEEFDLKLDKLSLKVTAVESHVCKVEEEMETLIRVMVSQFGL